MQSPPSPWSPPSRPGPVLVATGLHRPNEGEELAELAQSFRAAALEEPADDAGQAGASRPDRASPGFLSSLFDALKPARAEPSSLPPDDDAAAQAELRRRAQQRDAPPRWRR